ncbi:MULTISPECIES: (2Fe-2S)-binding protein [Mumia]|uniref:(2Fe-2S)-binding protein n=1 Tax=Mumia TaxID=1546255 RepID=UPI00142231FD|nr:MULTISPECIES: (2Fe-2S)-binding protein [unclassified Mumia]QMW65822.1 (2Fe-2S)-binding protein [Mumia sp. ZJ1417]
MKHDVELTVNGTSVTATVEARQLLVHFLREDLGLTGTHVGCDSSNCGACTVLVDGEAVKSCTILTVAAADASILTIEGLGGGGDSLTPVQQGFRECHGLQCGYCTPGMVMAATGLLLDDPDPAPDEIRTGLQGNLCRCTGYQMIVESVRWAAENGGPGAVATAEREGASS